MPVRSLSTAVLKWPDKKAVDSACREWAVRTCESHASVLAIGYFGSYADGTWGVGSDLDVVVLVKDSAQPFERRAGDFDTSSLPVSTDLLVYTENEWAHLKSSQTRFSRMLAEQTMWIHWSLGLASE